VRTTDWSTLDETTLDAFGVPVIITDGRHVLQWSSAARGLMGLSSYRNNTAAHVDELDPLASRFAPVDSDRITRSIERLGPNQSTELDVSMANGYQHCELRIQRLGTTDRFVVVLNDVTSEHAAQLTILYSAGRHRAVLEGLREGVLITDHAGMIIEANTAATAILERLGHTTLVERSHLDVLATASTDSGTLAADQLPTSLALDRGLTTSDAVIRFDGPTGPRWLSCSCNPIDLIDGPRGAVLSFQDVTAHTMAENDLAYLAHHDPLTGLFNRRRFRMELQLTLQQLREGEHATVLLLDLDGFKDVNDSLGHAVGDQVLVEVADRLRHCCPQADRVARLGGDEFAVLLAPRANSDLRAEALVEAISAPISVGLTEETRDRSVGLTEETCDRSEEPATRKYVQGSSVVIGTSIGIATTLHAHDVEHLLMYADTAMYASKRAGRGRWTHFADELLDGLIRRSEMRAALAEAIVGAHFTLAYQPKMRLQNRTVVGFEALLRWTTPSGDVMSPADFVPLAEETGQIVPIGKWVLDVAVRQLAVWQRQYDMPELTMAVNVSARQLTEASFVDDVKYALTTSGINPETLTLELTETMLIADQQTVAEVLRQIRALGVLIAIDDYGTGHASISYLRQFAIDVLKVDRSLVVALGTEDPIAGQAVVRSITDLAASLQLTTVAEGIEDEDQLSTLQQLGCDEGQGFLLAMPLTVDEADAFLATTSFKP
jgi:diguanylate cyclase (GGDEF)-like protein